MEIISMPKEDEETLLKKQQEVKQDRALQRVYKISQIIFFLAFAALVTHFIVQGLGPQVNGVEQPRESFIEKFVASTEPLTRRSASSETQVGQMDPNERTFVMIKPDGVARGLIPEILKRFQQRGYKIVGMKFIKANEELLRQHYGEHQGKPFFDTLVRHVGSGPVLACVFEGGAVVKQAKYMTGETNPLASEPGTIRGDFGIDMGRNVIHTSDTQELAKKEIKLWFKDEELVKWEDPLRKSIYE